MAIHCESRKVSIIGLGNVGATAAYALLLNGLVDQLVLLSRDKSKAEGEKSDLEHGLPFLNPVEIIATDDYQDIAGSDIVVVTAGVAQKPGETRLDLVKNNLKVLHEIIPQVAQHAPDSIILMVSNPVDVLTYYAARFSGFAKGRVLGSGTMLDTARFRFHLGEFFRLNPRSIHTYILGEHGDSSFPVLSSATVGGQPLDTFPRYTEAKAMEAFQLTKTAAYSIIQAKGATYYAIGVVISQLVKSILKNERAVMPVSTVIDDYYGESGVAISVPCILGRRGVEQVLKVPFSKAEQQQFKRSCDTLRKFVTI